MNAEEFSRHFLQFALDAGLILLGLAFLLTIVRIWRGPTLPDRVLGLDVLTGIALGFIGVIAIDTGYTVYVILAIGLALVGFLATVAFARFILARGAPVEDIQPKDPGAQPLRERPHATEEASR